MGRLTQLLRKAAFVCSGGPEITLVELRLRASGEPVFGLEPERAVAAPFEFRSVVCLVGGWPHWPAVYAAA